MIRPVAALLAPLVAVGLWAAPAAAAPAGPDGSSPPHAKRQEETSRAATRMAPEDSFLVRIDRVSPAVLPTKGDLRLSGTVKNVSSTLRTGLNVHPLSSYYPITSGDELTAAAEATPEVPFGGDRLQDPALLDNSITELGPGRTARWSLRVPVDKLRISGGDGVYVVGVQVLSDDADGGRDGIADGRARTFVPRMRAERDPTPTSLVLPIRAAVHRDEDGTIQDEATWQRSLDRNGRLDNLLSLLEEEQSVPVSLALDPSLLDTTQQLADGNQPRTIEPTVEVEEADEAGSDSGSQTSEGSVSALAQVAKSWRARLVSTARKHSVLSLPYADLDVAAASRRAPARLTEARELADATLGAAEIPSRSAVVPPSGLLPAEALRMLPDETLVLLSGRAAATTTDEDAEDDTTTESEESAPSPDDAAVRVGGHVAVLHADIDGGADPQDPRGATGIRQRILAEAAVRSLAGAEQDLVVSFPADFDPGRRATRLMKGLDADFIRWQPLASAVPPDDEVPEVSRLNYPDARERLEVPESFFAAAQQAIQRGRVLDDVLPLNDQIATTLRKEALAELSYFSAAEELAPMLRLERLRAWVDGRLGAVEMSAPSFVILSSESGPFSMTVRNGLDQPVEFSIRAETGGEVEIRAPESVALDPQTSRTINLEATSTSVGVHEIDLVLVTAEGDPLNASEQLNIRSNSVGKIIWVILAVGFGILAVAVPIRIVRRVRKVRAS
ncbi:hypothetical protein [Nocardioides daejeonensis]|uniref:hypothetical protein n=1 Tax=Nocardioides daejeonensis TaxID=1046556 RepID=UPI0013A52BCA|nr:hypothetical protein [Nocardioides daejeonensis]